MAVIENIFSSKTRIKLLRVFYDNPKREFSLTDLTRILKTSTGAIYPSLSSLVNYRMLVSKKVGTSTLYRLNYSNHLVKKIMEIFDVERDFLTNKSKEFTRRLNKKGITSIILFGSVARGQASELSDIDILIVYKKDYEKIRERVENLGNKFLDEDIVFSPIILSESEIIKMLKKYDSFILRVQDEGKVLYGKKLEEI